MGKLGFFGLEFPARLGGLGASALTAGLVLRGDVLPSIAPTEPGGGSDAASLALAARRDGDGYVLTGEKTSISFATQAGFSVVFARTGTPESRARGISAFLVPLDSPGLASSAFDDHGGRSVGRGSLFFDDVRVPASHLLGAEGQGFVQVMQGFDYSRALLGLLCPQTLWLKDQGLPHTAEAAICTWWGPKLPYDIVGTCLLTHGHGAHSTDLPYEQRLRDLLGLLGLQIGDGTAQIMKLVIARQKAGRPAAPRPADGGSA
jgi:cyclohexanecarboxyl-CoA dehydrogenase